MNGNTSDAFGGIVGRYLLRLKYDKLEDSNVVTDDQENDKVSLSLRNIHQKFKLRVISNLQRKLMSSITDLQMVRDAYVEAMHRFAGHVVQLNGNAYYFKKVTYSPYISESTAPQSYQKL